MGEGTNFLIDCGASSVVGLKAHGTKLNDIAAMFITHFHADHFGGIPFFMLDAQFFSKRTDPLTIVGPPGLEQWYERVMEVSFPGSSKVPPKFPLSLIELAPTQQVKVAGVTVTAYQAVHGNPGGPFLSYRLEAEGRVIAYTGDTEWHEGLVPAAYNADLFIAEAYFFEKKVQLHLDLASLSPHLGRIQAKRLVLTHMSDEMLARQGTLGFETAHDGKVIEL